MGELAAALTGVFYVLHRESDAIGASRFACVAVVDVQVSSLSRLGAIL